MSTNKLFSPSPAQPTHRTTVKKSPLQNAAWTLLLLDWHAGLQSNAARFTEHQLQVFAGQRRALHVCFDHVDFFAGLLHCLQTHLHNNIAQMNEHTIRLQQESSRKTCAHLIWIIRTLPQIHLGTYQNDWWRFIDVVFFIVLLHVGY